MQSCETPEPQPLAIFIRVELDIVTCKFVI